MASTNHKYAVAYARRGWHVLPLHWMRKNERGELVCSCGNPNCPSPGKHPFAKAGYAPGGLKDATTNETKIGDWWSRFPDLNVGIRTGAESGLVVLDIDPKNGGTEGMATLTEKHMLAPTLEVYTGGGGNHLYFAHPGRTVRNQAGMLAPGVDVRGDGGYVVAPPSNHASGEHYEFQAKDTPIMPMPAWMMPAGQLGESGTPGSGVATEVGEAIPKGTQHHTLVSIAGTMRRRGLTAGEIHAGLWAVAQRCEEVPPETNVRRIAESVAQYAPEDAIDAVDGLSEELSSEAPGSVEIRDVMQAVSDHIMKAWSGDLPPAVPTGLRRFDAMMGGLHEKELFLIAARPGVGKSAMAFGIARSAAEQGHRSLIVSAEMASEVLGFRWLSGETGISTLRLRSGEIGPDDTGAIAAGIEHLSGLPISISDASRPTPSRIRRLLLELKEAGTPARLVWVDYLGLVKAEGKHDRHDIAVGSVTKDLLAIAKDYGVTMCLLVQLNRGVEARSDKRPRLSDLRDSGQIEEDAHVATFLFRPEMYDMPTCEVGGRTVSSDGLALWLIEKNRHGVTGQVPLHFDKERTLFSDYDAVRRWTPHGTPTRSDGSPTRSGVAPQGGDGAPSRPSRAGPAPAPRPELPTDPPF